MKTFDSPTGSDIIFSSIYSQASPRGRALSSNLHTHTQLSLFTSVWCVNSCSLWYTLDVLYRRTYSVVYIREVLNCVGASPERSINGPHGVTRDTDNRYKARECCARRCVQRNALSVLYKTSHTARINPQREICPMYIWNILLLPREASERSWEYIESQCRPCIPRARECFRVAMLISECVTESAREANKHTSRRRRRGEIHKEPQQQQHQQSVWEDQ